MFDSSKPDDDVVNFVSKLKSHMQSLHPKPPKHHGKRPVFIHPGLLEATHVFLRRDRLRRPLQQPYDGPFKVLQRKDKVFFLDINGKRVSVSIDRCKPAFFLNTEDLQLPQTKNETPATVEPNATASTPATVESDPTASTPTQPSTRSGRKVHLPTRIEFSGTSFIPLGVGRGDSGERVSPTVGGASGFRVLPELYFSVSENVEEFLEGVENNVKFLEIPSNLTCAYLKGHLLGRTKDWYEIFGSTLVQDSATDFAQLKEALSKNFLVVRNRKDLEVKFYSTHQSRGQEPTDFIYDLLKVLKELRLKMSEEALVEHIFIQLEPQVQDYAEVRNPTTTAKLLQVMSKFEERYPCKEKQGSRSNGIGMCVGCLTTAEDRKIGGMRK
ncbi:uncharacterized protein TNCV_1918521 [Trichonephila clavipes]|nr:uncharacterized protein TNCV_1918521 [Trichonephila clavipes]